MFACVEGYTEVVTGCSEVELSQEERLESLLQVSAPQPAQKQKKKEKAHDYINNYSHFYFPFSNLFPVFGEGVIKQKRPKNYL